LLRTRLQSGEDGFADHSAGGIIGGTSDGSQEELTYTPEGVSIRKTKSGVLKKRDGRDQLPFKVYVSADQTLGDEDQVLGSYRLDASTAVGDVLDLGPLGVFSVVRVRFLYRYISNRLKVTSKMLEVTPLSLKPLAFLQ